MTKWHSTLHERVIPKSAGEPNYDQKWGKYLPLQRSFEKASWDKDVDVYFQKNSWADTEFYLDWSKKTFKAIVKETGNFILFLDNQRSWRNHMVWCT